MAVCKGSGRVFALPVAAARCRKIGNGAAGAAMGGNSSIRGFYGGIRGVVWDLRGI